MKLRIADLESKSGMGRRQLLRTGGLGLATTGTLLFGSSFSKLMAAESSGAYQDQANQIFLAALIAEDLATTFYYNGLVGQVIQDPSLAGPGGTAANPSSAGNSGNVAYVRAALTQEIAHANLLRAVGNFGADATTDPYQAFYFPAGSFDSVGSFLGLLDALENAFIGAYLNAVREFANLSARARECRQPDGPYGGPYSAAQLQYFAEVAASILGVESEHRALGRVISSTDPANNLNYEQTDGLTSVYNGPNSAVAALKPFLAPGNGLVGYCLEEALNNQASVSLPATGNPPAF